MCGDRFMIDEWVRAFNAGKVRLVLHIAVISTVLHVVWTVMFLPRGISRDRFKRGGIQSSEPSRSRVCVSQYVMLVDSLAFKQQIFWWLWLHGHELLMLVWGALHFGLRNEWISDIHGVGEARLGRRGLVSLADQELVIKHISLFVIGSKAFLYACRSRVDFLC